MEKYYNEKGEVGVLYSPGFGAGWSTWASEDESFFVFDKNLVELALIGAPEEDVSKYLKSIGKDSYTGGWDKIAVEFMKPGTAFIVKEYDGCESITYFNDIIPFIA